MWRVGGFHAHFSGGSRSWNVSGRVTGKGAGVALLACRKSAAGNPGPVLPEMLVVQAILPEVLPFLRRGRRGWSSRARS